MTRWLLGIALATIFLFTSAGLSQAQVHVTEIIAVDQVRTDTAAKLLRLNFGKQAGVVIYADEKRKELVLTGTLEQVDEMRAMLRRVDKKSEKTDAVDARNMPKFRYHDVPANNAEVLAVRLRNRFEGTDVRIDTSSPSRLFVWGRTSDHEQITTEINNFSAK